MTDEEAWLRIFAILLPEMSASYIEDEPAPKRRARRAKNAGDLADAGLVEFRKRFPKPEQPYR